MLPSAVGRLALRHAAAAGLAVLAVLAAPQWCRAQQTVITGTITGPNVPVGTGAGTSAASVTGIGSVTGDAARAAAATGAAGGNATGGTASAGSPAAATGNPAATAGARYVESCQQAIEHGTVNPGCQGPLYASEIARLREEALRTNSPSLLTLLGDAYQSNRSGISDVGQAYRWYLLAAVRGDPRAMQRLSDMYKNGRGAPQDNVKALGYARLAQRMAPPGSTSAQQATDTINKLGQDMAAEEVGLADRFAGELEQHLQSPTTSAAGNMPATGPAAGMAAPPAPPLTGRLPGMGVVRPTPTTTQPPVPSTSLPGATPPP